MRADAEIRVPAEDAHAVVIRVAGAAIAARRDFTLEAIEDLRIALGEACAMALSGVDRSGGDPGDLRAVFAWAEDQLSVEISAAAGEAPSRSDLSWQLLLALAPDARAEVAGGRVAIRFSQRGRHAPSSSAE